MTAAPEPDTPTTLADHANHYATNGWQVFPVHPDTKAPLTTNGMKDATTNPATIAAWWNRHPTALIGCRIPEHLVVLDLDPRHGALQTWAALETTHGPAPTGMWHQSGRRDGGHHRWYQHPGTKLNTRNLNQWAQTHNVGNATGNHSWTAGIDILHHNHRYTILPPSPHPATRLPYTWEGIETASPMPDWLTNLLTTQPAATTPPLRVVADPESIADWYTTHTSWHDILPAAGWQLVAGDGDTDGSKWRHPNASAAWSATTKHGCLFVYTDNTDFPVTEQGDPHGLTRFRAWAILEHDNNTTTAAAAAHRLRDGDPATWDLTITAPPSHPDGDDWPDPQPITTTPTPPLFPIGTLPAWIADHATAVADELQTPIDLPATLAIAALSTITTGHARIDLNGRWTEDLNLYLAVALPPGAGKSPAFRAMTVPIAEYELELAQQAAATIATAEQDRRITEKALRKAEEKGDTTEARRLALELTALTVPASPRLIVDDTTTEALVAALADQNGRLALLSTEGGIFDLMAGRYSDRANLDAYLQAWSGDTIRVDRIGRGATIIPKPLLTIGLTVQPAVIARLAQTPELAGRGLTARFMYAVPADNVGRRNLIDAPLAPRHIHDTYNSTLAGLARRLGSYTNPGTIRLAPDALDLYMAWRQSLENRRTPTGDLRPLTEWTTKLETSVVRLAGLLHVAETGTATGTCTVETITKAVTVGGYWLGHAKAVHALWAPDEHLQRCQAALAWLRKTPSDGFTARDLMRSSRSHFPTADDARDVLETLIRHGWVRILTGDLGSIGTRRLAPVFAAHPSLGDTGDKKFTARDQNSARPLSVESLVTMSPVSLKTFSADSFSLSTHAKTSHPGDTGDTGDTHQTVTTAPTATPDPYAGLL